MASYLICVGGRCHLSVVVSQQVGHVLHLLVKLIFLQKFW